MHQTQWSPERPLPPPVSLASHGGSEKPPGDIFVCPKKKIIKLHALQKVLLASKVLQQNSGSFPIPKPGMR